MKLDPRDPQDRTVLRAARSWGVPPSQFLGADSPQTHYQYNQAGEMVSSFTESAWDDDDTMSAIALQQYEDSLCPGCGGDLAETTSPEAEERYLAHITLCHRCVTINQKRESVSDHHNAGSLLISADRRAAPTTT